MARIIRTFQTTILLGGLCTLVALPAAAQGDPPPVDLEDEGDVAPEDVSLEAEPQAEPAPPPPAAPDAQAGAAAEAGVTVGVDTTAAAAEEETVIVGTTTPASRGGVEVGQGDWEFGYHGFFRAPMRIGIGKREDSARVHQGSNVISDDFSQTTLHLPLVPDDQYLSWQKTNHSHTDWAEMFFSVGNPYARGVLAIEGYNFSQGSYSQPNQQFGISQGYVEIMPELPYENVRLRWRVGAAWGTYGKAGRWDAGEYDTYLFGRTKGMGEIIRAEIDVSDITLAVEHGISTKRPDASVFNTSRFSLLNHAHGFLEYGGLMAGLHFLHAWSQEEDRDGTGIPADQLYGQYGGAPVPGSEGNYKLPDGSMTIVGAEIKLDSGPYGLGYIGFAHMNAKRALTVAPVVEWLHADGGGEFNLGVTSNYLDNPRCQTAGPVGLAGLGCSSGGTGQVNALLFQYEFSVANLLKGLEDGTTFWGDGMDFKALVYAMYNQVSSDYVAENDRWATVLDAANPPDYYSDHSKLKFGTDLQFSAFPAGGMAVRFDRVQPNSNLPEQGFSILSPRLIFRSRWITREMIIVQYSRYMYDQRACDVHSEYNPELPQTPAGGWQFSGMPANQRCVQTPAAARQPEGWGSIAQNAEPDERGQPVAGGNPNNVRPDINVITVAAQMWW